jgi:serine protease inhibitor
MRVTFMQQLLIGQKLGIALLAALVGLSSISCGALAIPLIPKSQSARPVNPQLIEANTQFGFKLFQAVQAQTPNENVMLSPSSVAIALSMAYNGANGATQAAMAQALQLNGMNLATLNQANEDLQDVLAGSDPKVQLKIANSLWARKDMTFEADFLRQNQKFYKARVSTLDFQNPDSVSRINNWVNRNTSGKIPKIIDRINDDDLMYLINAVYFKGSWSVPFKKTATVTQPFTLANGKQKPQPLMSRGDRFSYAETDQFQAVSLPYGSGRWSMYVFLPKPDSNLAALTKTLSSENWQTWMKRFQKRQGLVQLPKFKADFSATLNPALTTMGMGNAFTDSADFSKLSPITAMISKVQHKTFVEVNEEGTEAAAVTSVGVVATSAQVMDEPFSMVIDRPFFCAIRDSQTGTILFMGNIQDPGA